MIRRNIIFFVGIMIFLSSCDTKKANEYSGRLKTINSNDYNRFILIHNSSIDYVINMTMEHGVLIGDTSNYKFFNFGFHNSNKWITVKIPDSLTFNNFHNLTGWYNGYKDTSGIPDFVIGIAIHKSKDSETYYFYQDPTNNNGDTQIGVFNNGTCFFVYQPEAYEKGGNLKVTKDIKIQKRDIFDFLKKGGYNLKQIDQLKFDYQSIKVLN